GLGHPVAVGVVLVGHVLRAGRVSDVGGDQAVLEIPGVRRLVVRAADAGRQVAIVVVGVADDVPAQLLRQQPVVGVVGVRRLALREIVPGQAVTHGVVGVPGRPVAGGRIGDRLLGEPVIAVVPVGHC